MGLFNQPMFENSIWPQLFIRLQTWIKSPLIIWRAILLSSGLVTVVLGLWLWHGQAKATNVVQNCPFVEPSSGNSGLDSVVATIVVDINGAVAKPGIYELPAGSRYADLIEEAGGLDKSVSREYVAQKLNLAKELKDQEKVYLPFAGETTANQLVKNDGISINTATSKQLQELKGVGEATAEKIISGRPYKEVGEIKNIVSEKIYLDNLSVLQI